MTNIGENNVELVKDLIVPGGINETNIEAFKLSQDFEAMVGVRKEILTVPVCKPNRQAFIQIHPSEEWRMSGLILEFKEDRDNYLVAPHLWEALPEECGRRRQFYCPSQPRAARE